jgi:hypothetical protein
MVFSLYGRLIDMRSKGACASGLALLLILVVLTGFLGPDSPLAAGPPDRYQPGDRNFSEFEIGDLRVFWHQRMVDDAFVENDFIVYQFDKTSGELMDIKSHWRDDLPDHLPPGLLSKADAMAFVTGKVEGCRLYFISPESDVYPIKPPPENPCWVVRHVVDGALKITVVDALSGAILGNGVPPPYEGFSLTGPWEFAPCSGAWTSWKENARSWFETMGYSTQAITWPTQDEVRGHIQSCETAMFYELAHGSSTMFESGCVGGTSGETTYASEIESWIAAYPKMPFAFIGSCGGLCWKFDGTFAYEFRKGEPESTSVVGYCNMAEPECALCWEQSIAWQSALFSYMNQGWTVRDAFDRARADYPACGDSGCVRFAGDREFAVVPVVRRDPWPPAVEVTYPNGGETLEFGTVYEITWEARDNGLVDSVAILLSLDGGLTYPDTLATGEPDDSSYLWTVPDIDSKTARIKVTAVDCAMNQGEDDSDSDFVLWGTVSGAESPGIAETPAGVLLDIIGSNPIGGGSRVRFGLPAPGRVRLALYDVMGRCVDDLLSGRLDEGFHTVTWSGMARDGSHLRPGLYLLRLETDTATTTAKVVVAG